MFATAASKRTGACQAQIATPCRSVALPPRLSQSQAFRNAGRRRMATRCWRKRAGQAPQQYPEGPREHQERRGNGHNDFMLDHVKRKEVFAQPVERRNERSRERQPSEPVRKSMPTTNPRQNLHAATARMRHAYRHRPGEQRDDDPRIEGPG